jgi:hypothetical protein
MRLNVYLCNILLASVPVEYDGLVSCEERQKYHERLAAELLEAHVDKLEQTREQPLFIVEGVTSKMNYQRIAE